MPTAGVELGELRPGQRIGPARAVGGAVQRVIVEQEWHPVCGQLDVKLDHAIAVRIALTHRRERVLRRELPAAAMGDVARIRPVLHTIRAPLPASNRYTRFGAAARAIGSPTVAAVPGGSRAMIDPPATAT